MTMNPPPSIPADLVRSLDERSRGKFVRAALWKAIWNQVIRSALRSLSRIQLPMFRLVAGIASAMLMSESRGSGADLLRPPALSVPAGCNTQKGLRFLFVEPFLYAGRADLQPEMRQTI